jgi:hypothetical protein
MAHEPEQAVVEWGGRPAGRLRGRLAARRVDRHVAPVLAGFGATAALGAVLSEWQTTTTNVVADPDRVSGGQSYGAGIASLGPWGTVLLLGLAAVAVCLGVTFAGDGRLRPYGRSLGLVVAAVQVGVLVAATADLSRHSVINNYLRGAFDDVDIGLRMERGVVLAYLAMALAVAALYLAPADSGAARPAASRPGAAAARHETGTPDGRRRPDPDPAAFGAPEVTVAPAEPFRYVTDRDEWV